jgi:hypothetical protein
VSRKVKMKLSQCLTKHHAMKMYGRVEVQLHALLTSELDGGEWSASRYGRFYPCTHWIGGWVVDTGGLDIAVAWRTCGVSCHKGLCEVILEQIHVTKYTISPI